MILITFIFFKFYPDNHENSKWSQPAEWKQLSGDQGNLNISHNALALVIPEFIALSTVTVINESWNICLSNHLFIKYSWNLSVWAILSFFGIHAGPKIYWAMIFFKTPSKTMLMDPGLNWEVWLWKDRDVITHVIVNGREWIRANWLIFLDIKLLSFGSQAWNGMQHHNFVLHLKRNINFFHYKWISCTGSDF